MALYAAYTRVSRVGDRSETLISPRLQQEAIAGWARANGHEIEVLEPELDLSGGEDRRPILLGAIDRIEAGEIAGIAVWKFNRFTRSLRSALRFLERIEGAGGQLRSASEPMDPTTPAGRMSRNIVMSIDQGQREEAAEGFERAKADAIARGVYVAGRIPLGYRRDADRRLEPDPVSAEAVTELIARRAAAQSWKSLAAWLGDELGRGFTPSSVRAIVRNPAYLGIARQGTHVNRDAHPPLVSRDTWEAAQATQPRPPRASEQALLAGLVRCAGCQRVMTAALHRGMRIYRCRRVHSGGRCPDPAAINVRVEAHVVDLVLPWAKRIVAEASEATDEVGQAMAALERAELELRTYLAAVSAADVGPDQFAAGAQVRRQAVDAARGRLRAAGATSRLIPASVELVEAWEAMGVDRRRQVLGRTLGVVWVRSGRDKLADRVRVVAAGFEPDGLSRRGTHAGPVVAVEWVDADLPGEIRMLGSAVGEQAGGEAGA